jgi:cell division topological specificity factor
MGWLSKLFNLDNYKSALSQPVASYHTDPDTVASGSSASKRLKLVLMHDRTQMSSQLLEQMRDELVEVISKYVEIDKEALEINLESESNTIALVANIPVLRARAAAVEALEKAQKEQAQKEKSADEATEVKAAEVKAAEVKSVESAEDPKALEKDILDELLEKQVAQADTPSTTELPPAASAGN